MKVKKARKLRDTLLLVGMGIMLLSGLIGGYMPLRIAGVIVTLSCLIPHFLFNRCPHCGRQLGRNTGEFCQFCGKPLE